MTRIATLCIVLLLIFQADVFSQQRQRGMPEGRDRLETLRQVRMIEALDVDEETAARLTVMYNRHQENNRTTMRELDSLIDELEAAIDADASDAELEQIQSQIEAKRNSIHASRMEFLNNAREILSTRQVAKLIVFERNFQRDMREFMREAQREQRRRR
jgi:hypothetical protein